MTTDTPAPPLLQRIVEQREKILRMRDEHAREAKAAQRELAELIAATRDDPDPAVNPSAASRAMGTARGWAHAQVAALEAGEFDDPDSGS